MIYVFGYFIIEEIGIVLCNDNIDVCLCRNCIASRDPYCGWTRGSTCSLLRPGTRSDRNHEHPLNKYKCLAKAMQACWLIVHA